MLTSSAVAVCPSTSKSPQTQTGSPAQMARPSRATARAMPGSSDTGAGVVRPGSRKASAAAGSVNPRRANVSATSGCPPTAAAGTVGDHDFGGIKPGPRKHVLILRQGRDSPRRHKGTKHISY